MSMSSGGSGRGGYDFGGRGRGGRGGRGGGRGGPGGGGGGGGRGGRFSGGRGGGGEAPDVICRHFLTGECKFGASCRNAHNVKLLKQAQAGPAPGDVKLRGLSMLNATAVVANDGSKLRILSLQLDSQVAEFALEGPVDALLVMGSLVFAASHAPVPGHTAAVSPVAHIRAILVRPGAEPVQWSLHATGQVFAHRDKVNALDAAFVADDQAPVLFSGSEDGLIRMWQLNVASSQWACIQTLEGHARGISALAWVHSAQRLYSGSTDGTIKVWNPAGSCTGTLLPPAAAAAPVARPGGFLSAVHGAAAPAAAAASDGPSHGSVITGLAEMALGGGTFLISAAIDGSIKAWMLTAPDAPQLIPDVKVAPDDKRLISSMICVELESAPGAPLIITGHLSGSVTIRDVNSALAPLATIGPATGGGAGGQAGHSGPVRALTQGPGDIFYSGAEDGFVCAWQCVVSPPPA